MRLPIEMKGGKLEREAVLGNLGLVEFDTGGTVDAAIGALFIITFRSIAVDICYHRK